jgi:hypothetical protein
MIFSDSQILILNFKKLEIINLIVRKSIEENYILNSSHTLKFGYSFNQPINALNKLNSLQTLIC